jgi:UPF0176 protein
MQANQHPIPAPVVVAALYKFVTIPDPAALRDELLPYCQQVGLLGTVLLASEGINGTVAGSRQVINGLVGWLRERPEFADLQHKESITDEMPFYRMKVRLKKEIVTLGVPGIDPTQRVGTYVEPEDWNDLISDPEVALVDTRNRYEVHLGTFDQAMDPGTESFRDFPRWVAAHLDPKRDRRVAMFCTGGIRCEKATAYLLDQGFESVYHLKGGILKYLEEIPEEDSLWRGECFVFDNRVTVDHQLQPGNHEICFNCRMPLSEADRVSPKFQEHVSCPHCFERLTPERRDSLLERAHQLELAGQRGEVHIGRRFPDSEPST